VDGIGGYQSRGENCIPGPPADLLDEGQRLNDAHYLRIESQLRSSLIHALMRRKQSRPNIDAGRAAGTGFQSAGNRTLAFVQCW
jgi:hypothetical protein